MNYEFVDHSAEAGKNYTYYLSDVDCCTGVCCCGEIAISVPFLEDVILMEAFPNPFNPQTMISFILSSEQNISLKIFDISGNFIDMLYDGLCVSGKHEYLWRASNVPSGIYVYSLETPNTRIMKKCLYIK
jgi:hypothetical protein